MASMSNGVYLIILMIIHFISLSNNMQVKILNKLASARALGNGGGSKVLTDLIDGLQEPAFTVELRLKINQNHPDLKGG